jgi:hypothetical protein
MMACGKSDDPDQILNLDPAALAIRASQSYDTLQKLKEFANQLSKYVSLMEDAKVVDLSQDDDGDAHIDAPPSVVARRSPDMVPRRRARKRTIATTPTSETNNNNNIGRGEKRKASQTAPDRQDTTTPSRPLINSKARAASGSVRARTQVATATPSPSQKRPLSVEEDGDGGDEDENDDNDEDYMPGERLVCETVASNGAISSRPTTRNVEPITIAATPSPKTKRISLSAEEVKNESEEELSTKGAIEPAMSHRCPRKLAPGGVKTDLKRSLLERSVGRTRKVLNEHLEYLGLTAKFNVPVVSKHGSRMSHLTFKSTWNDLPQSRNETLEWWLGEGPTRIALASPLDPSIQKQPLEGIPVFWATPNSGADICYYVGHFRCIAFFKTRRVVMLGKARQALIELQFVKFDESLAQKIATIK